MNNSNNNSNNSNELKIQLQSFHKSIERRSKLFLMVKQVFGVGDKLAKKVCFFTGFNPYVNSVYLSNFLISRLNGFLEGNSSFLEGNLKNYIESNIGFHVSINSYKGNRHSLGFPVRGQRTHTNRKTFRKLYRIYLPKVGDK